MTLTTTKLVAFIETLQRTVANSSAPDSLPQVAASLAAAYHDLGLPVDRLQLPLSILFGLKHPLYAGIVLTWTQDKGSKAWLRPHSMVSRATSLNVLRQSPFAAVAIHGEPFVRLRRGEEEWSRYGLLRELEEDGYQEYVAIATPLPDGARQVISLATRRPEGFDANIIEFLKATSSALALALYGIYQSHTAHQIATTYLGQHTGRQVLQGQMGRGRSESLRATIAFMDIRDFTRISNELGIEDTIPLLNETFEAIEHRISALGGEILKFMGDAALVVFPFDDEETLLLIDVIETLLTAVSWIHDHTSALGTPIRLGVGLHIGEVLYGNVGAKRRHDFTVMGPAVNLASRLEGLTKSYKADIIVSQDVAITCRARCGTREEAMARLKAEIIPLGPVEIRGEPEPVEIWGIQRVDVHAT